MGEQASDVEPAGNFARLAIDLQQDGLAHLGRAHGLGACRRFRLQAITKLVLRPGSARSDDQGRIRLVRQLRHAEAQSGAAVGIGLRRELRRLPPLLPRPSMEACDLRSPRRARRSGRDRTSTSSDACPATSQDVGLQSSHRNGRWADCSSSGSEPARTPSRTSRCCCSTRARKTASSSGRPAKQILITDAAPVDHLPAGQHHGVHERMVQAAILGLHVIDAQRQAPHWN